jgi:mannitol-1-/sugar-/sorbitol-6-phosphatase
LLEQLLAIILCPALDCPDNGCATYTFALTHLYPYLLISCGVRSFQRQAILFDLDGVLVDSTAAVARVWRRWALEHGLDPESVVDGAHGRRSIETIRLLAPHLDAEQENVRVEAMEIADRRGVKALPGADRLLRELPPHRFTVVTSATRALAQARMQYAKLSLPSRFISADDVREGKPSPEPYLTGAQLLGFAPADCLVFEDTPSGIASARAGGMQVIAVATTYPSSALTAADTVVNSLAEVNVVAGDRGLDVHVEGLNSSRS